MMRPDEHKKKKNALYKKKHGIQTEKKRESAAAKKAGDDGSTSSEHSGHRKGRGHPPVGSGSCRKERGSTVSANFSTSQDEEEMNYAKLYQRRKLDSNWKRYEVECDESPTRHGADFAELLKSTYLVKPQFQFSNFHGLDVKSETVHDSSAGDFLSLNCQRLSEAVQCVPVHELLDIDASLFEKSDIESFERKAAQHAAAYRQACSSLTQPVDKQEVVASAISSLSNNQFSSVEDLLTSDSVTIQQNSYRDKTTEMCEKIGAGDLVVEPPTTICQPDPDEFVEEIDVSSMQTPDIESPSCSSSLKPTDSCELAAVVDSISLATECDDVCPPTDKGSTLAPTEFLPSALTNTSECLNTKTLTELEDELESLLSM